MKPSPKADPPPYTWKTFQCLKFIFRPFGTQKNWKWKMIMLTSSHRCMAYTHYTAFWTKPPPPGKKNSNFPVFVFFHKNLLGGGAPPAPPVCPRLCFLSYAIFWIKCFSDFSSDIDDIDIEDGKHNEKQLDEVQEHAVTRGDTKSKHVSLFSLWLINRK